MVSITEDEVRARFHFDETTDIDNTQVGLFLDEAVAILSHAIGVTLVKTDCTELQANALRNLAALYCYCWVTGGSAAGLNFSIGDINISESSQKTFDFIKASVEEFIRTNKEKPIPFVVAQDDGDLT